MTFKNFFSNSWTSGSENVRPMRRFSEPIVFLKLDVSCVFAASPIARCFGPKATRDLCDGSDATSLSQIATKTYGVARFETSLVMISIPRCRATPIYMQVVRMSFGRSQILLFTLLCNVPKSTPTTAMMKVAKERKRVVNA